MTGSSHHPRIGLRQLPDPAIHALADGELATANTAAGIALTPYFVTAQDRRTWQRRSRQLVDDPACAGWITRIIVDLDRGLVVGRAGYHGPPDERGMVEVGYAVDPPRRRQGYARAALVSLLHRAVAEPTVSVVRATISPSNQASRDLILQYGFREVGEQWDDEDGLETIFEVAADADPLQP
ncbi:MAG TPA: GNAT family N-acetyltransferase [Jatrophihabitans sp.]|nr:GNAT family N-acetyltransferase [Jatrophihabitans sp.]